MFEIPQLHHSPHTIATANLLVFVELLMKIALRNMFLGFFEFLFSIHEEWYRILCLVLAKKQKPAILAMAEHRMSHHSQQIFENYFSQKGIC